MRPYYITKINPKVRLFKTLFSLYTNSFLRENKRTKKDATKGKREMQGRY